MKKSKKNIVISDQHFIVFMEMPCFSNYDDVIKWVGENEPMRYIFEKARRYLKYNKETQSWQGRNYGKKYRELLSQAPGINFQNKTLYQKLEIEKIDLLPPLSGNQASYISDWEAFSRSEIIYTLKSNKNLIKHFIIIALQQGYIVRDENRNFVGIDY